MHDLSWLILEPDDNQTMRILWFGLRFLLKVPKYYKADEIMVNNVT